MLCCIVLYCGVFRMQVLRPLLFQLDIELLEMLVEKLHVQPPEEVIEDTVAFIKDIAEATQQVTWQCVQPRKACTRCGMFEL